MPTSVGAKRHSMDTFNIRDIRIRPVDLVRIAEHGLVIGFKARLSHFYRGFV